MKKTPFLSCILAALLACSAIPQARADNYLSESYHMKGNKTWDLGGQNTIFGWYGLYVEGGVGNVIKNGSIQGGFAHITTAELTLNSDMSVSGTTISLKGGATLDLGGRARALTIYVEETGNIVKNGTLTGNYTLEDTSLTLDVGFSNVSISMKGKTTLNLSRRSSNFDLTVTGTGNRLQNGDFIGTLTLAENSALTADSAMCSWDGPTSITMENGSRLEMAIGYDEEKQAWKDNWINDIGAIKVEGVATIKDAFIRIKPKTEYTLGNGVEYLVGEGITSIALDNSIFNLDSKTTNLNIKVWAAFERDNVIKNGTINTHVEIDSTGKLTLDKVTFGSNAAFTMGDGSALDLGGAETRLAGFTLTGTTATVDNGTLFVGKGETIALNPNLTGTYNLKLIGGTLGLARETPFTLDFRSPQYARFQFGNTAERCLYGDARFSAGDGSQISISGQGCKLNMKAIEQGVWHISDITSYPDLAKSVTLSSDNYIIIGKTDESAQVYDLTGNFDITYTGSQDMTGYAVNVYGRVHGDLKATALTGGVNAGLVNGNATVVAQQIFLSSLLDGNLSFSASNTVTIEGDVDAKGTLVIVGKSEGSEEKRADITFYGSLKSMTKLTSGTILLSGKNISGLGAASNSMTSDKLTINATDTISIQQTICGTDLSAIGVNNVTLGEVGHIADIADIRSSAGNVTFESFTGYQLSSAASGVLTVKGSIVSTKHATLDKVGDIKLEGAIVSTQDINALGKVSLRSTGEDSVGQDGTVQVSIAVGRTAKGSSINASELIADAKESITVAGHLRTNQGASLTAGGNITFGDEAVVRGSLDASAEGGITMEGFFYDGEDISIRAGGEVNLGSVGALQICEEEDGPVEDHPVGDAYVSSKTGPVTIYCFAGRTINASADGALTIGNSEDDAGINSTGEGKWSTDGTGSGPFAVRLAGSSITAQYITSEAAVYLESTKGDTINATGELQPSIDVNGEVRTNALQATAAGSIALRGCVDIKGNGGPDSIIRAGGQVEIGDTLTVEGALLNIMNIAEASSLKVADVTIGNGATIGVYTGATAAEDQEGTLTIAGDCTLTAGARARLNADLVMKDGSTLDVRGTGGMGLLMGSTVTLNQGMTLNDYSADWATWKDGTTYVLFSGVDGLGIGDGMMTGTLDYTRWVDASEYFTNIEETNRYFLCYGGAPDPGAQGILTAVNDGSTVGMVYIMTMPEPTTGTLSLLALAALAARRRRK